jgi:Dullard-like phosphatase family protein
LIFGIYFYNSTIFLKFEIIFKNSNEINILILTINLILFTIIICYDFSFESNNLINIYLFLSELLELNHRNLILILEHISNQIIINNKDNNWIIRAYNIINNFNLTEDNEYYYKNANYAELIISKINKNINSVTQKINYILLINKTNFNECLIKFFSKIKLESFTDIDEFFKEYLLRENFIECSVTAKTFLKENSILEPENAPYIKNVNKKKFSLVLDLDETLISFKLNREQNDEGVLKLRPNLYKFLDNVMEYYEIILFTEASQSYIDLLINALEENKKYFEYKLYRQHTVIRGNDFIKDLTRIGRPLNSIIIVDNMPQNFRLQKGNGINIKSFWGEDNEEDNSLLDLMTILINIAKEEEDVRNGIIKYHDEIITKITSNLYKHNKY